MRKTIANTIIFPIIVVSGEWQLKRLSASGEDSSMSKTVGVASVVALLFLPLTAFANGFGWWRGGTMSNYCPVVVYVDPCPTYVPLSHQPIPGPQPRQVPLAAPKAAPPSAGPISADKNRPEVTESRSFYEAFKVQPTISDKPALEQCALGFWNLTGRDVTVSVDGKTQVIPQGKSLKLQVGRQFVWQLGGHEALTEKVPTENSGLEIVLRR
jgi:hypothetical protein